MLNRLNSSLLAFLILFAITILPAQTVGASPTQTVSPNIPLDSYIYPYLAKLDGLGYLKVMLPDTKPYTRMQVAKWVKEMTENSTALPVPDYARKMLERLQSEFSRELLALNQGSATCGDYRIEASAQAVYYDGEPLMQHPQRPYQIQAHYQPLNVNNNGYRLVEGLDNILTLDWEGTVNQYFAFGITPRLGYDREEDCSFDLTAGYIKTRIGNLGIQLGKDARWWGPGEWGNLTLTNNAEAQTAFELTNVDPIELGGILSFLKEANGYFHYSELKDRQRYVKDPSFVGFRATFTPLHNFTFGASLNSIVGGEGHQLSRRDYLEFLTGKNADSSETEKWNSNAGFDFSWKISRWNGIRIYGELYGEDQAGEFPPLPSRNAYLCGVYFPRLTTDGKWDLKLEKAHTTNWWYQHWVYQEGYTYKDHIIGDAMGYNAIRYDLKLTRYLSDGSWLDFGMEHLTMDRDALDPQQVNSLQIACNINLKRDLIFNAMIGVAYVENMNYQADRAGRNYLGSVGVRKRF